MLFAASGALQRCAGTVLVMTTLPYIS
jgi:hypothetical protein